MNDGTSRPKQREIEERAYQIYLERGAQDGQELSDWLAAERELTASTAKPDLSPASTPKTSKRNAIAA